MKINDVITYNQIEYSIWLIDEENQTLHLKEINNEENAICIEISILNN